MIVLYDALSLAIAILAFEVYNTKIYNKYNSDKYVGSGHCNFAATFWDRPTPLSLPAGASNNGPAYRVRAAIWVGLGCGKQEHPSDLRGSSGNAT